MKLWTEETIAAEYQKVFSDFSQWKAQKKHLNMARGKPGKEQLEMVSQWFAKVQNSSYLDATVDARNYGELQGLPCARQYFADLLSCQPSEVFVGGNASLALMYDTIAKAFTHGLLHSEKPWAKEKEALHFLCPAPGYDRHFRIVASFGMELQTIPMTDNGPDMDMVEELIKDPRVKGMWNVPKYSNPEGIIYSEETIERLASMKPAAPDFLLMWDNAYAIHEFEGSFVPFRDILRLCASYDNADMVFEYTSTSKITFPGAGISCFACSEANMKYMMKLIGTQIISYDKMNQFRHSQVLQNKEHTLDLMQCHASILKPKFEVVLQTLEKQLSDWNIATWHRPKGGYFVSLDTLPGLAQRTLQLCQEAGVTMTEAGATFPYGKDALDRNIRIAPSYPSLEELQDAMDIFCTCLRLAFLEQKLSQ